LDECQCNSLNHASGCVREKEGSGRRDRLSDWALAASPCRPLGTSVLTFGWEFGVRWRGSGSGEDGLDVVLRSGMFSLDEGIRSKPAGIIILEG